MRASLLTVIFFIFFHHLHGQNEYPKDYFRSPLEIPLYLAGNFGEIRSNHFHAGLDLKTEGVEGKNILASAAGYIARIKVSTGGYGKVLYVNHPNGYTTVYAHLKKFSDKIEKYVQKAQYSQETFEIELFPAANALPVAQSEVIAISGNTGGSGGPHLHFEIRETETETPVNPLLFNFDIRDNIKPILKTLSVYPLNENSVVNNENRPVHIPIRGSNGNYRINRKLNVHGTVGFGIEVIDKTNGSSNRCGAYSVQLEIDNNLVYGHEMEKIGFYETRYINSHVDYNETTRNWRRIQRCFIQPNNKLGIYTELKDRGAAVFMDDSVHQVSFSIKDAHGNISKLEFPVHSSSFVTESIINRFNENSENKFLFKYNEYNSFENNDVIVSMPANILYDDLWFEYRKGDTIRGAVTPTHYIHHPFVPLHSHMTISIRADNLSAQEREKALIVALNEKGQIIAPEGGSWQDGFITVKTRSLGPYTVMIDSRPPKITGYNIYSGKNMKNSNTIMMKIYDNLSGIKSYRGTIDGEWILMEYDYKKNLLTYYFDEEKVGPGQHVFKLTVTDNQNNSQTYEAKFSR